MLSGMAKRIEGRNLEHRPAQRKVDDFDVPLRMALFQRNRLIDRQNHLRIRGHAVLIQNLQVDQLYARRHAVNDIWQTPGIHPITRNQTSNMSSVSEMIVRIAVTREILRIY